jgi:hypothetical protein
LRHEVKGLSLYQADLEKSSGSTNERKQMSTKTNFKRLALVVVSALGLGLFGTVTPANAAATSSISLSTNSITVISPSSGLYDTGTAMGAVFKITLRNAGTTKTSQPLQSDEAISISVVGVPAGTAATAKTLAAHGADLVPIEINPLDTATIGGNPQVATTLNKWITVETGSAGSVTIASSTAATWETSTSAFVNSYYFRVVPARYNTSAGVTGDTATVVNQGEYTLRVRLTSGTGSTLVEDETVKVRFVTSAIGAGLSLTAAAVGTFAISETMTTYSATKYARATLQDANGGRVVSEASAGTTSAPTLLTDIVEDSNRGIPVSDASSVTSVDDGSTADMSYSSATAQTNINNTRNGVYGIKFTVGSGGSGALDTVTAGSTGDVYEIRTRFGDQTVYTPLTIVNAKSSGTAVPSVIATGLSYDSAAPNWYVPTTTTSVDLYVSGAGAGNAVTFTPSWSNAASGNYTPADDTAQLVYADSSGVAKLTLTNSSPVNGASVTVEISGFNAAVTSQVITWAGNVAYAMSLSGSGAIVALKSTNTVTATVTDRFGAPVAGVVLQPSLGSDDANGSDTATYASVTTDASGKASYTWTDAAAAAADTDTVTFTHITSGTAITAGTSTITYAATAPAPTTITPYYYESYTAGSVTTVNTPVPSTGIYKSGTTRFEVVTARDNSKTIATSGVDLLTVRIRSLKGAAVVATTSTGFIRNSAGLPATSSTKYGNTTGDVYFHLFSTKTGANTATFTSGAATTSVSWWVGNATSNARFVTLTGPATGVANGELGNYKVTVTDRFGNGVSGASLSISATGAALFGGGATLQTFTTGSSGEFTFTGTSFTAAGGTGTFTASMTNSGTDATSTAGKVGSTVVESSLAAGNSSATVNVTYTAGQSAATAAAEAASDAAAEAIDAANAATDAANLAAEAADAATVAAEEARDAADAATAAVEELATQVATLMAALKAQITTLANTVAKIAKKVKA